NFFYVNGDLIRFYTYRSDYDHQDLCGSSSSFNSFDMDQANYTNLFIGHGQDFEGDSLGSTFTREQTYTVGFGDYQLTVEYKAQPSVKRMTGADGSVAVLFQPGRNIDGETRGIAGIYLLKVRSTRFTRSEALLGIRARYPNLQPMPAGAGYIFEPSPAAHPQN